MPKKKSIKKAAQQFKDHVDEIESFVSQADAGLGDKFTSWAYDYAIIRLYREFESLMLDAISGAINNDSTALSTRTGYQFPKHMTQEVAKYLVTKGGYFDFKGRSGLIKVAKDYLPEDHYLLEIIKKQKYKQPIERLSGLRNYAAHNSAQSKKAALEATEMKRMSSAGAWLKIGNRLQTMTKNLKALADEVEAGAPY